MPKRKHKKYSRPKKPYDAVTIKEENALITKYGLKNRREVWKANYAIGRIRNLAKELITAEENDKQKFIERQKAKGLDVNSIADILALNKEDYLKRRLQSIVVKKGFAKTPKQARQLIIHKHIYLNENVIDSPAHLTTIKEEDAIGINISLPVKEAISNEEKEILEKINKPTKEKNGE